MLVAIHDRALAAEVCERVVVRAGCRIAAAGPAEELLANA